MCFIPTRLQTSFITHLSSSQSIVNGCQFLASIMTEFFDWILLQCPKTQPKHHFCIVSKIMPQFQKYMMCQESFYSSMYAQEQKTVPIRNWKMISIIISLSKISWVLMQKISVLCCYMSGDSLFTFSIGLSDSMLTPQGPPSPHQKAEQLLWPNVNWGGDSTVSKNRESR
jgi:hypothetical protein